MDKQCGKSLATNALWEN